MTQENQKKICIFLDSTYLFQWKSTCNPPIDLLRILALGENRIADIFITETNYYEWIRHIVEENLKQQGNILESINIICNPININFFLKEKPAILSDITCLEDIEELVKKITKEVEERLNKFYINIIKFEGSFFYSTYNDFLHSKYIFKKSNNKKHIPDSFIMHSIFKFAESSIYNIFLLVSDDNNLKVSAENKWKELPINHSSIYTFKNANELFSKFSKYWPNFDLEWESFCISEINSASIKLIFDINKEKIVSALDIHAAERLSATLIDDLEEGETYSNPPSYISSAFPISDVEILKMDFHKVTKLEEGLLSLPITFKSIIEVTAVCEEPEEDDLIQYDQFSITAEGNLYFLFSVENEKYSLEKACFKGFEDTSEEYNWKMLNPKPDSYEDTF